jgi:hypothetical protein
LFIRLPRNPPEDVPWSSGEEVPDFVHHASFSAASAATVAAFAALKRWRFKEAKD